MTSDEEIHAAKAYVALSAAHRIDLITPMLAGDAAYESANVGSHVGVEAMVLMMTAFFARFPDVWWDVAEYRHVGSRTVAFDFVMNGTNAEDGNPLRRVGHERVTFDEIGQITRVDVL
jgi:hypothetical protein